MIFLKLLISSGAMFFQVSEVYAEMQKLLRATLKQKEDFNNLVDTVKRQTQALKKLEASHRNAKLGYHAIEGKFLCPVLYHEYCIPPSYGFPFLSSMFEIFMVNLREAACFLKNIAQFESFLFWLLTSKISLVFN